MRVVAISLCLCDIVLVSTSFGQEAAQSALDSRLREEAPAAWKRLESKCRQTHCDWKETRIDDSRDKQTVTALSGSDCFRGEDFVVRLEYKKARPEASGGNDRYLFTVQKSRDDGSWALADFGPRKDDSDMYGEVRKVRFPWCIYNTPAYLLMADPTFRIQSLQKNQDASIDVQFSVSPHSDDIRFPEVTSGRVVLLPDRDWAISEYELHPTRKTKPEYAPVDVSAKATYGPEEGTFINLTHTALEQRWQSDGKQRKIRWETDLTCQHCDEPAESFTLAAFGLPEPALPSERKRIWLWLNIAAVALLMVAFILRSRRKAHQA
jgi:hypothetical protein